MYSLASPSPTSIKRRKSSAKPIRLARMSQKAVKAALLTLRRWAFSRS